MSNSSPILAFMSIHNIRGYSDSPESDLSGFEMADNFIPGLDQPGDWSERQIDLYNGHGLEHGDIRGHLTKSIAFIEELGRINSVNPWNNETIEALTRIEIAALKETLAQY